MQVFVVYDSDDDKPKMKKQRIEFVLDDEEPMKKGKETSILNWNAERVADFLVGQLYPKKEDEIRAKEFRDKLIEKTLKI
jgi:hypothetical protein